MFKLHTRGLALPESPRDHGLPLSSLLSRGLFAAIAVLLFSATSSALGAHTLHAGTKRAAHHGAHNRRGPLGRSGARPSGRSSAIHVAAATTASSGLLLGDEALESQHDSLSAGEAEAFPFQALASGLAGSAHVYVDTHSGARTVVVGLYANAAGHPGALLTSGSLSSPKAHAWNTASVAPVELTSGTTYWLAVLGRGGTLRYRDRADGPCQAETNAQTGLAALPGTWTVGTSYSTCPISAYLTGARSVLPVDPPEPVEPPVEEHPKTEPPLEESSGKTNCIALPSACGYPDATNSGVPAGTKLTSQTGELSVTKAGTTVKNLAVTGEIDVEADNTTLEDDEVIASAGSGNRGIYIAPGVTGTVIDHTTCHGAGKGTQYCVFNKDSSTKIEYSYLYNCGECLNGSGTITNSFFDVTAVISGEHYEDIYYGGGEGPLIVNHDTMLNPQEQTATVFASTDFGDQTTLTITDNLLAGGGYTLYGGTSCTTGGCGSVKGPVTVTGNRFSRRYYPESGYYGLAAYFDNAVTTWSGNVWDETLKSVEE